MNCLLSVNKADALEKLPLKFASEIDDWFFFGDCHCWDEFDIDFNF